MTTFRTNWKSLVDLCETCCDGRSRPTTLLVRQSYTAEYGTDLGIPIVVWSTTVAFSVRVQ